MRSRIWPLVGMMAAATAMLGSCAGALVGHYTVSGGLHINGWQVPQGGSEVQVVQTPDPVAPVRKAIQPEFPDDTPPSRFAAREPAASYYDSAGDSAETFYSEAGDMQSDRSEDYSGLADPFD